MMMMMMMMMLFTTTSRCFLGFEGWGVSCSGRGSGLDRPRVSDGGKLLLPVLILHESTVKGTFNTPCELLWGLSGEEAGVVVTKLGVLTR